MSKSGEKSGRRLKNGKGDPPGLEIFIPNLCDLPNVTEHPSLPIDILLVTVKECEFLSCYAHLKNPFKGFIDSLGTFVYFGTVADDQDASLKIGLMRCDEGATGPGGSLITVKNAITALRPKGAVSVGYCSGLNKMKTKLGDVIVSAKLTTYASKIVMDGQEQSTGIRTVVSRRFLKLIRHVADGWKAPLKNPKVREVKVHSDGEILSGPERISVDGRRDELVNLYPQAMALEMEGEGLYVAAFDQGIEWLVVKGIADFADESTTDTWQRFASVMAASVVFNFLSDAYVFRAWPHYQDLVEPACSPGFQQKYFQGRQKSTRLILNSSPESTREKGEDMSTPKKKVPSMQEQSSEARNYLECHKSAWKPYKDYGNTYLKKAGLIKEIRQRYIRRDGWLAPFSWDEAYHFQLDRLFTIPKVVRRKKTRGILTTNIVNMSEIFKPHEECSQPRIVLIEGKPGMGKTTYCRKIAYDWANEKLWTTKTPCSTKKQQEKDCFPKFETVLLLSCYDMKSNLWEAIDDQLLLGKGEEKKELFNFICKDQSKVLLLLDGLDEVPTSKLSYFKDIIEGRRELSKCHMVATARHEAGMKIRIHCDTLLEIEGFAEEDAMKNISKFFDTAEDPAANYAETLLSELRSDKNLKEMLTNPLHTALLCLLCEENKGSLPESRSKLYLDTTRYILRRYRKKKGMPELEEDLIEVYDAELKHLGRIALDGLLEDKLDFEKSELRLKSLKSRADELPEFGFLSVQTRGHSRPSLRYSFQHKSFQEWFAALSLSCQLIKKETSPQSLVADKDKRYAHELKEVLPYTCGLLAARCKEDAVTLTTCMMTQVNQGDSDGWLNVVLECIRECKPKHSSFQADLAVELGKSLTLETLKVHDGKLSAANVIVLADVLKSNATVRELNLNGNDIGDDGAASLAVELQSIKNVEVLKVSRNGIGDADVAYLASALKFNTTLTALFLSLNRIGEAGAAALADGLKSNKTLTELDLAYNDIGDVGAATLANGLTSNRTLLVLYLSANGISNGVTGLADGLKSNTALWQLNLSHNAISDAGAAGLADLLKSTTTLSALNLSRSGIGDAGAAGLADALKANATPTVLNFSENSIGAPGIANVADGLKSNTTLSELYLSSNRIGDDGVAKLADALQFNTSLTVLDLSRNKIGDAGAANLADGLKSDTNLRVLHLSGNGIGDKGATCLAGALESNKTLAKLYLRDNDICDAGAAGLADALKSNTTLTALFLSRNPIGENGLAGLGSTLKSNRKLTVDLPVCGI